ncbi:MAG: DegQ family serine endoprotease [Steroidobacteraceae bacterium]
MTTPNPLRRPWIAAVAGAATVAVPAGALYLYGSAPRAADAPAAAVAAPPTVASPSSAARYGLPDFSALVDRYGDAVVNISVKATVKTAGPVMPQFPGLGPDDPIQQFFRGLPQNPHQNMPMRGEGSGFIVGADGVILTNAHVVANADKVTVKLKDRREFEAKVLGQDEASDVAVIKIDAKNLPTVKLGRPDSVRVGQWVVAIGAPFGFDNSVTAGIVSALGRNLPDDSYVPFIQTDVAINPGNSGGPLFNLDGEVIGINSQIYSRSGGYEGISFAIPIDVAMNVGRQLQANGHVTRGRLGVNIQDVDQALAESFGLDAPRGALVSNVEDGSPAAKAGLRSGDVILAYGGRAIDSAGQLPSVVAATAPGTEVELQVWRDRSAKDIDVKVGEAERDAQLAANGGPQSAGRLGLAVRPLSPDERRQAEVNAGLLVEDAEGAAAEAGIRPGDIVLSANGAPTSSVADLKRVVTGAKDHVALLVQRGEARIFVPVELG